MPRDTNLLHEYNVEFKILNRNKYRMDKIINKIIIVNNKITNGISQNGVPIARFYLKRGTPLF